MIYEPYEYQERARRWIIDHPRCGLFLDMGLGKTVITLTAVLQLIDEAEIERVLVVAPKKVAETTWTTESTKWEHLRPLRVVKVMGTAKQRERALASEADVYVIGRDSFVWLTGFYNNDLPFDMIVLDELTTFKNSKSQRFKAMRKQVVKTPRIIGLTGTPTPNGLIDLWAEMYCIDAGERLGKFKTKYEGTYFSCYLINGQIKKCNLLKGADKIIMNKISDICISMKATDYLRMPDYREIDVRYELEGKTRKMYDEFERDFVLDFVEKNTGTSEQVIASSAVSLMNKLSQFANGAIYGSEVAMMPKTKFDCGGREVYEIHDEKLERLAEIVEAANGEHVLVFYQYKHDAERIKRRLKGITVKNYDGAAQLEEWNAGKIDVLLAHPASTAFGLNMQQGGHYIVWFGTGWNLELYQQANARLYRQGQKYPVTVYRLICANTVDDMQVAAIARKDKTQEAIMNGLKLLREKYDGKGKEIQ